MIVPQYTPATPCPWRMGSTIDPFNNYAHTTIWGPTPARHQSEQVAQYVSLADAELIIRAVATHDQLVMLLRGVLAAWGAAPAMADLMDLIPEIRVALLAAAPPRD